MSGSDRRPLGWLLAATGMLLVSTDSLWVRTADVDAWDIAFWVALLSLPLYGVLSRVLEPARAAVSLRTHWAPLVTAGTLAAISQIAFITALTRSQVANVVAIVAAAPVLAAGVAWIGLRERTSSRVAVAIVITVAGVAVIVGSSLGDPTLDGDLLALLAVGAFAVNITIWRRYPEMSRFVGLSISSVVVVTVSSFFASPFSLDQRAYLAVAAMGLCFNPLGRLAHTNAPRFAPVSEVALFTPIETVAGTFWAWLFFDESPRTATVIGGIIVITGVFYGTLARPRVLLGR